MLSGFNIAIHFLLNLPLLSLLDICLSVNYFVMSSTIDDFISCSRIAFIVLRAFNYRNDLMLPFVFYMLNPLVFAYDFLANCFKIQLNLKEKKYLGALQIKRIFLFLRRSWETWNFLLLILFCWKWNVRKIFFFYRVEHREGRWIFSEDGKLLCAS